MAVCPQSVVGDRGQSSSLASRWHFASSGNDTSAGRKARRARAVDLMIAAIACSVDLPLYTKNPKDFAALEGLVEIVAV